MLVTKSQTKQLNIRYDQTHRKMLIRILGKKSLNQTQYLLDHIEKDYQELFGDMMMTFEGKKAYFVQQNEIDEVKELIKHYQDKGLEVDDFLFSTIVNQKGGIIISGT